MGMRVAEAKLLSWKQKLTLSRIGVTNGKFETL